jgi:5S rRNA maturation endonuclease (ribonuclease M5)
MAIHQKQTEYLSPPTNYDQINQLSSLCALRIEELLDHLGLSLRRKGRMLVGSCPVHGGDNMDSFTLYPEGEVVACVWKCRSHLCHLEFKKKKSGVGTLIGLVWGILSHQRYNWQGPKDQKVPFNKVIDYLCDFIGQPLHTIKVDKAEVERKKYIAQQETLVRTPTVTQNGWSRSQIRGRMQIPAKYYLGRNYNEKTLDRYDVGVWLAGTNPSPIVGRIAVPIYDEGYKRVIGITARTIHNKCNKCQQFHAHTMECPSQKEEQYAKWINNKGFRKENFLYNYWFAKEHIRKTGVIVLVEGPGDVWRLEEAGVQNAVGTLGNELSDSQQVIIERSGAMTVVHIGDRDAAGEAMRMQIETELGRGYRLRSIEPEGKDVGDMTPDDIRRNIVPILNSLSGA